MTDYSVLKAANTTLNSQSLDNPSNNQDNAEVTSLPAVKIASKVSASPHEAPQQRVASNPKSVAIMTSSSKPQAYNWVKVFNQTFLPAFAKNDDPLVTLGKYDYAFQIGTHRLYVLVEYQGIEVSSLKISKQAIASVQQKLALKLTKRFQQLRIKSPFSAAMAVNEQVESVSYIGLTSITAQYDNKVYPVNHKFGSIFFQEECVLDLDNESQVIQLFSIDSLINIIRLLQTSSDVISFLEYHLKKLVTLSDFVDEFNLAQDFLINPLFFKRAYTVQKKLVDIGLLAKIETRLEWVYETSSTELKTDKKVRELKTKLIAKLQETSRMFQKLLNGVIQRQQASGDRQPNAQLQVLLDESMYTRMSIMDEILAYGSRSQEERANGYLCHQHSYNKFGHHYVLIVYGLSETAVYSSSLLKRSYSQLLMDINSQLQDPVMDEYYILGFDMSNRNDKGNVSMKMEVFHQSGSTMTIMERRLYEQVQALSNYQS